MRDLDAGRRAFKTGTRLLVLAIALSAPRSAAQSHCVGDCAADGAVSINDLILGVNIALGRQPVTACPAFQNAQGEVDIAQLVRGVTNALGGCPAVATATATSTPHPDATPTHTAAASATATATSTPPPAATATHTAAASATATATEATAAATPTATGVAPATSTSTSTAQSTATTTRTATPTSPSTATETSASTMTPPSAGTATHTPTGASTATSTEHSPTRTATNEPTATSTDTPPPTGTVTHSSTAAPTATVTPPPSATATATRTATATETPLPVGELLAGHIAVASAGLRSVHSLVAAFVSQATKAGGAVLQASPLVFGGPAPDPDACSISGTSERTCTEMGAGNDKTIQLALDATDCVVAGPSGGTALFTGLITVDANPSSANACDPFALASGMYEFGPSGAVGGLLVVFRDALMEPTLAVRAAVSGMMAIGQPPPPTCRVGTLTLTLDGLVLTQFGDSSEALGIQMGFSDTELTVDMITYNADCVPLSYRLRVNGLVSFTATRAGPALTAGADGSVGGIGVEIITSFTAFFTDLFLAQSHASGSVTSQISGQMGSDCFGADVMIATVDPIVVGAGDICPNAGQLSLTSFAGPATVTYQGSQVNVVEGGSEKIFPSCLAVMLTTCIPQ